MQVELKALIFVLNVYLLVHQVEAKCNTETLAVYEVHLETFWDRKDFPKHYPEWRPPASWSKMLGFSHDDSFEVFRKGETSSPALKQFAEKADSTLFEIHTQGSGGVFDMFTMPPIGSGVGSGKSMMLVSGNHTKVSVVSKIMPSPDWFIGVDSYDLCPNGRWLDFINLELGPLDAGTDKGLTFTSPKWPTEPQEKIQPITAHYPSHPAGSFYYPNIDELPILAQLTAAKQREYGLKDTFDAADHSINVIPEDKKDKYRYDVEGNKYENEEVNYISEVLQNRLKNQVDFVQNEKRRPAHRRFGTSTMIESTSETTYQNRKKPSDKSQTTIRPGIAEEPQTSLRTQDEVPTIIPDVTEPPPQWILNPNTTASRNRSRLSSGRGRKRIPSGDVMAVIDDIVKDYQKEHRRKIKKRRREERKRRREQMKKIKPPRDCRVSEWNEWSSCSKTCGIGEQTRTRDILKHAKRGGKPCPVLQETTWCGSARDCPRDYFKWR